MSPADPATTRDEMLWQTNLSGGAGNDTYVADNGDTSAKGIDSVFTNSETFTLANNVESLTLTDVASTGNGGSNVITGGGGNDTLNGAGSADTLIGGGGKDPMNGGTGNDTFPFAAGFGNDTISGFDANPHWRARSARHLGVGDSPRGRSVWAKPVTSMPRAQCGRADTQKSCHRVSNEQAWWQQVGIDPLSKNYIA